ncbi:MAG: tyrosine-type recombinase/integrase [Parabacteroides sp.]|nr:tyrosine-type recombinase/integrase [Parabacteroides sp.]
MTNIVYNSIFQKEFQGLIDLKRALGFEYIVEAAAFKRIDIFFIQNDVTEKKITKKICDDWCRKRTYESVNNQSHRISTMRVFCSYLNDIGINAYVPPKGITKKRSKYEAHIYTDDELRRFFAEVDKSQSIPKECPYRGLTMPIFFRILYTSGMRVSELRLLKVGDINFEENYFIIHNAKNHKERIVPVHPRLIEKCRTILNEIHTDSSAEEYFFMIRPGQAMTLTNVYHNFRRYLEHAGISHTGRGHGPRVHDFRHTYCVNLLRKWVDEEKNLMTYLPYMRTMLGHEGFEETAYYLKLTTERFPYIKNQIKKSFPDIIKEVLFDEHEFY